LLTPLDCKWGVNEIMFFMEFLIGVVIALVFSFILVSILGWQWPGRRSWGPSFFLLFIILLLATWAGGLWLAPFGPMLAGVYWLPFVIVGLLIALIMAAIVPPRRRPQTRREALEQADARQAEEAAIGGFFWVAVVLLVVGIIIRYTD